MSRIYESSLIMRSIERGEPQATALHKLASEHRENQIKRLERLQQMEANIRYRKKHAFELTPEMLGLIERIIRLNDREND